MPRPRQTSFERQAQDATALAPLPGSTPSVPRSERCLLRSSRPTRASPSPQHASVRHNRLQRLPRLPSQPGPVECPYSLFAGERLSPPARGRVPAIKRTGEPALKAGISTPCDVRRCATPKMQLARQKQLRSAGSVTRDIDTAVTLGDSWPPGVSQADLRPDYFGWTRSRASSRFSLRR